MKVIKNIVTYILIILLACTIIGAVFINIVSSTILSKQYILNKLEETNYYAEIKKEIESSFENYIGQSGLDEEVIKDIVSIEQIKKDTNTIIENIYDGTDITVDTTEIETNLKNNIESSLENKKLTITQQKAIEEYIQTIAKQYKETMSHTKYESNINNVIKKVNKYIEIAKKVAIIGIVVICVLSIILNFKKQKRCISQIGISFATSGIFYIILKMYIDSKIKVANIVVLNEAISNTVRTIGNDILSNIIFEGVMLACFGILGILLGNFLSYSKKAKEREE